MPTGVRTLKLTAMGYSSQSPRKPNGNKGTCTEKKAASQSSYIKRAGVDHLEIILFTFKMICI